MERILTEVFSLREKQVEIRFCDGRKDNLYFVLAQIKRIETDTNFISIFLEIKERQFPKGMDFLELYSLQFYPSDHKWYVDTTLNLFPARIKTV